MKSLSALFTVSIVLSSLILFSAATAAADEDNPPKLFSDTSELKITLSGPWRKLKKHVKEDAMYPAQLGYVDTHGEQQLIDVQVAPRGITRRLHVCKFPPLKVHFDKEKTKGTEFRGNKSLKLVTYCDTNRKYEQYYTKEFLAYRIYNLITEYSFRVKPLTVEYNDSENGDSVTRFGFLIEDLDDVAKRNDLEKLEIEQVPFHQLDAQTSSNFSLFQYLIGNVDWAATGGPKEYCCHNSKLIGAGEDITPKYGIPYDFDSSGLVNAHYASPPASLHLRNIRQRLYRGFCVFNHTLPRSVELYNEKKPDILALFENNRHLTDKNRKLTIDYIEEFYQTINDPKKFESQIINKCRG